MCGPLNVKFWTSTARDQKRGSPQCDRERIFHHLHVDYSTTPSQYTGRTFKVPSNIQVTLPVYVPNSITMQYYICRKKQIRSFPISAMDLTETGCDDTISFNWDKTWSSNNTEMCLGEWRNENILSDYHSLVSIVCLATYFPFACLP
jgi:hypothetical protein